MQINPTKMVVNLHMPREGGVKTEHSIEGRGRESGKQGGCAYWRESTSSVCRAGQGEVLSGGACGLRGSGGGRLGRSGHTAVVAA